MWKTKGLNSRGRNPPHFSQAGLRSRVSASRCGICLGLPYLLCILYPLLLDASSEQRHQFSRVWVRFCLTAPSASTAELPGIGSRAHFVCAPRGGLLVPAPNWAGLGGGGEEIYWQRRHGWSPGLGDLEPGLVSRRYVCLWLCIPRRVCACTH